MEERSINVSIGLLMYLKPFYITTATDKEKVMCMCKFCLNFRNKFEALMAHSKKYDGPKFDSISSYFMGSCACPEKENGHWALDCCVGLCKRCSNKEIQSIPNLDNEIVLTYHQFVVKEFEYVSPKTHEITKSTRTIRDDEMKDVVTVYNELKDEANQYLKHRFQVENDRYQWRNILSLNNEIVFHMDYSENVSGSPKYEAQDAHFSKNQFSLHCTVAHHVDFNKYIYHLSNVRTHNHYFTLEVVHDLATMYNEVKIFRFKTDNCAAQYKCLGKSGV